MTVQWNEDRDAYAIVEKFYGGCLKWDKRSPHTCYGERGMWNAEFYPVYNGCKFTLWNGGCKEIELSPYFCSPRIPRVDVAPFSLPHCWAVLSRPGFQANPKMLFRTFGFKYNTLWSFPGDEPDEVWTEVLPSATCDTVNL